MTYRLIHADSGTPFETGDIVTVRLFLFDRRFESSIIGRLSIEKPRSAMDPNGILKVTRHGVTYRVYAPELGAEWQKIEGAV
jgi:hypothetical protein